MPLHKAETVAFPFSGKLHAVQHSLEAAALELSSVPLAQHWRLWSGTPLLRRPMPQVVGRWPRVSSVLPWLVQVGAPRH